MNTRSGLTKNQRNRLDLLNRKALRGIQPFCPRCGQRGEHLHHLIPCGHIAHRYDEQNRMLLCLNCHGFAHAEPDAFAEWLSERFPESARYVEEHRHDGGKVYLDYHEIRKRLEAEIRLGLESVSCG